MINRCAPRAAAHNVHAPNAAWDIGMFLAPLVAYSLIGN
jgi:hypothetical protein